MSPLQHERTVRRCQIEEGKRRDRERMSFCRTKRRATSKKGNRSSGLRELLLAEEPEVPDDDDDLADETEPELEV
jgi:hypothetical protein